MSKRTDYLDNIISGNQEANKSERQRYLDNIISGSTKTSAASTPVSRNVTTLEEERANEKDKSNTSSASRIERANEHDKMLVSSASRQQAERAKTANEMDALALDPNASARKQVGNDGRITSIVKNVGTGVFKDSVNLAGSALEGIKRVNDVAYKEDNQQQITAAENSLSYWNGVYQNAKTEEERKTAQAQIDRANRTLSNLKTGSDNETKAITGAYQSLYDVADELAKEQEAADKQARVGLGKVGNAAVSLAEMGGSIGLDVAMGGLHAFAIRGASEAMQNARQNGASYGQQLASGALNAAGTIAGGKLSKAISGSTVLSKFLQEKVPRAYLSGLIKSTASNVGFGIASEAGSIASQEVAGQEADYAQSAKNVAFMSILGVIRYSVGFGVAKLGSKASAQSAQAQANERPESEYFNDCNSLEEVQKKYRKLSLEYADVRNAVDNVDTARYDKFAKITAEYDGMKRWFLSNAAAETISTAYEKAATGQEVTPQEKQDVQTAMEIIQQEVMPTADAESAVAMGELLDAISEDIGIAPVSAPQTQTETPVASQRMPQEAVTETSSVIQRPEEKPQETQNNAPQSEIVQQTKTAASDEQIAKLSDTFGENGKRAFTFAMADGRRPDTETLTEQYAQFSRVYNEGKKNVNTEGKVTEILETIPASDALSPAQRILAFSSGINDAKAEMKISNAETENKVSQAVAKQEESGYTYLESRLNKYDTAETDGLKYTITNDASGYVVDIKRNDSKMGGMITNARSDVYHGGPFATREEAVNNLLSVAKQSFYREEGSNNVNGVQKVPDGRGVLPASVPRTGSRGLLDGVPTEDVSGNESGRNTPADVTETRNGAIRNADEIDRGTEDAGRRGVGVRERGDLQPRAGEYGLSYEQEHAVLNYKSSESYKINAALRDNMLDEAQSNLVKNLDESLKKLPYYHGTIYRTLNFDDFKTQEEFDEFIGDIEVGMPFTDKGYMSFSTEKDGYPLTDDVNLGITIEVDGNNAHDLSGFGNNFESEVLYERKTRLFVKEITKDALGRPYIYMTEDNNNVNTTGENERHRAERGEAVRELQEHDTVQPEMQGVSAGNSGSSAGRGMGSQGTVQGGQRNSVRAEGSAESENTSLREEQDQVTDVPETAAKPSADLSEELQKDIEQSQADSVEPKGANYVIPESGLKLPNGEKARYKANVNAIKTLRAIMSENRMATAQEQEVLSRYVGWGGIPNAFSKTNADWAKEYKQLKEMLSEKEWEAAFKSTQNAHFTSVEVIRAMYRGLQSIGFNGGRVLEPSCGVGNFAGAMPVELSTKLKSLTMVELDDITGNIAQALYPNANVMVQGFETAQIPDNYMDLAIGNVPFGNYSIFDKSYPKAVTGSIHNYFFGKSIDKVRPGGILCFITSRFTMDARDGGIRDYMMKRADLIGAIRLPDTAFKGNAGTEVVTDILVFKKREAGTPYNGEKFDTVGYNHQEIGVWEQTNDYFNTHPEMVLGTAEKSGTMYRSASLTYKAKSGNLEKQIEKAFSKIKVKMDYPVKQTQAEIQETIRAEIKKADSKTKNGSYVKQNGKLYKNKDGELVDAGLDEKQSAIASSVVEIRDTARQLLQAQQADLGKEKISELRKTLNDAYDAFVKKNGPLHKQGNKAILSEDADAPFILALEEYDSKTKVAKKSAIFEKDTITPHKTVDHVDNIADGFSVSINETGGVDVPMIAKLLGVSEKEATEKLVADGLAFKQKDESYMPAQSYLAGNVRAKLKEARALANVDKSYQANVDALEKVVPADIAAADVSVRPGATWIPAQVYADFAAEILGGRNGGWSNAIDVTYSELTGTYKVEYGQGGRYLKGNSADIAEYGTADRSFIEIFEAALNSKDLKVYFPHGKDEKAVVNPKATIAVKEKKNKILDKFQEWMWSDEKRVSEYGALYNDLFNCTAVPNYDGSSLVVDGLAAGYTMREHQANAVQRIIMSGGNVLLAHGTGAGKTLEMASAAMKLRQIGAVKKPMIVVPKNLLGQWENEFRSYYPAAKLLVPGENDFTAKNRKTFANKIATGDYDAVIVTQEHFERIPLSAEAQTQYYKEQIAQIIAAEEESKYQKTGKSFTVKQLAKKKSQLEAKIQELADVARDENNIEFESLGVDALFVDEAHGYKNLFYTTQMSNVADLGNKNGAKKSSDLYMKVQYLQKLNGGRGIVFGTATPVMNSVVEMYTMQRYLQGDILQQKGIGSFDAWASEFGDVVEINKMRSDGKGYETKQSMSRYRNLGELQQLFRSFADVVTQAPGLKLPKVKTGGPIVVECDPSEAQESYLDEIGKRADAIRSGRVDVKEDNILKVYGDGKKMSYTQRMIDTNLPYEQGGKILTCVTNVLKEYKASDSIKGTQLIFCDRGVPGGRDEENGVFLYKDIKDLLVKGGIPEREIAFAQSYKSDKAKEKMQDDVNDGKIRVLIGSTQAMGTGLNIQKRAVAMHELNAPDRPGDIEQNRGRIVRQKNMNDEVSIFTYITKRTFDSRQWDNLKRKGAFIHQVIAGDFNGRTADGDGDFSASAAEIAAIASDNPLIIEQNEVSQKISTLEALSQSHAKEVSLANRKLAEIPNTIAKLKDVIENLKKDIAARKDVSGSKFTATILGTEYTKASEAGSAIIQAAKDNLDMTAEQKSIKVGEVAGLEVYVSNRNTAFLKGNGTYDFNLNADSADGTMTSALHTIKTLDARLSAAEENLTEKEKEIEKYKKIAAKPFEKQSELDNLRKREDEIMEILNPKNEQGAFDGNGEGNNDDVPVSEDDAFVDAEDGTMSDRSEQWTASRVGENKKPKRLSEIVEQIQHDFNVNATTGHIHGKNTLGLFTHNDKGIRSRIANDLPTIAHELGHYFDFTYAITGNGLSAKMKKELTDNLSEQMKAAYKKEKHVTEGLAEFMRKFLQNRETAAIDYPEFTKYFLSKLSPKDLALIEQLADDVNAYYSLDADTATSSIRFKEEKNPDARTTVEKIKDASDAWYQDWVDALHSIKQFDDATGSDVYKLAINSLYKDAVAGAIITGDLTDKNGRYISSGLKGALLGINLKDKEEYRLFNEYLVVKHGPERLAEGKRIFADDKKNSTNFMNRRALQLELQHPQFVGAAERLYQFQKDFKQAWLVDTGLLSKEMSNEWDERWEFYVPLNRAVEMKQRGIGAKRGFANQSNPIKRASVKGSGLDTINPVDNIIDNIIRVVNAGMQNDVMLNLCNAAIKSGADATIMEKIPAPMKKTIFSLGGIKEKLNDAGDAALSTGDFDTKAFNQYDNIVNGLDDIIEQYSKGKPSGNIVTVLRRGETEFWKINDPLLLSSLMNLSPARSKSILEGYGRSTRFMTSTATGTNVVWSIFSNFPRDLQTLLVYTDGKDRLRVIPEIAKSYINTFKGDNADPLYKEYLAMGGGQTSVYTADKNVAKNAREKLAGEKTRWLNPLEWIGFVSEMIESGPRYATYKLMREKGMTPQEAIYASHDITVNFRRGGVRSRELNKVIPFFNAGVQGLDKYARWQSAQDVPYKDRKQAAKTRFLTFLTVNAALGAIFYGINNANDEMKEDYQQLSNYTKNNYWLFPLGDGQYFAIPKARELSVMASFTEALLERTLGKNEHAFDEFYDYFVDTSLPGLVSDIVKGDIGGAIGTTGILGVLTCIVANRDFLGRPIESAGMQYLEAKDRYNDRTSKLAYSIGQEFNMSPQKIDYFFQQIFGGFWKAQKALMPVGGENVDLTLGVQGQYVKDNQYSQDLTNWLYDKSDASAKSKKSNPSDMDKAITAAMDDRMTSFYSTYNKLSKNEESTVSTRGTRQVVLTMINEYRKADDNGSVTSAQKAVYGVCKRQNSTEYLPSTMQPTVKDGNGSTHTLSGVDYVEYQLNYNRLYWEYVEDNINSGNSDAEKAAICTAAKSVAKEMATNSILSSHSWAKTDYAEQYSGVNANNVVKFKAYIDVANDDGSLTQEEVIAAIERLNLSKEQSSTLFHSRYDSDKNNPYK